MKKTLTILVVGISFLTTGCVNTNTSITIDKNDNAIIENKILIDQSVLTYGNTQVEELFSGKDDITREIIKPDDKNLKTEKEKIEEGGYIGYKYTTTVHKLRKVDISPVVGLLEPKNGQLFEVKDKFFSRHYVLNAEVKANENESNTPSNFDIKAEDLIKSKFSVTIPTKPISHNADTITEENQLFWDISPSKSGNTVTLEFSVIKWHSIILTCILGILLITGILVTVLKPTILNLIKNLFSNVVERFRKRSETEDNIEQNTESKVSKEQYEEQLEKQEGNDNNTKIETTNKSKLYLILGSFIGFILIASLAFFFSIPKISEYLITKSIENVYLGKIDKAISQIDFVIKINKNGLTKYSEEYAKKCLNELNAGNINNSQAFAKMLVKMNEDKAKTYSTKISSNVLELVNQKKYNSAENAVSIMIILDKNQKPDLITKLINNTRNKSNNVIIDELSLIIKLEPNTKQAYLQRGKIFEEQGRSTEAINDYSKYLELDENNANVYFNRGKLYSYMGNYKLAIADFSKVIQLSKDNREKAGAYISRGHSYVAENNYTNAYKDYEKSAEYFDKVGDFDGVDHAQQFMWMIETGNTQYLY